MINTYVIFFVFKKIVIKVYSMLIIFWFSK